MRANKHEGEEIVGKLREVEIVLGQGYRCLSQTIWSLRLSPGNGAVARAGWSVNHKRVERIWWREV